jgi:hypothetical protein
MQNENETLGLGRPVLNQSPEIGDLAKRLSVAMSNCRNLDELGYNKGGGSYSYVTIGQVVDVARQALAGAGVALFYEIVNVDRTLGEPGRKATEIYTLITCEITISAADSGQWKTCTMFAESRDYADKGISKAFSQLQKTFLMKLLGISSSIEDEPDAHHPTAPQKSESSSSKDEWRDARQRLADIVSGAVDKETAAQFWTATQKAKGVTSIKDLSAGYLTNLANALIEKGDAADATIRDFVSGQLDDDNTAPKNRDADEQFPWSGAQVAELAKLFGGQANAVNFLTSLSALYPDLTPADVDREIAEVAKIEDRADRLDYFEQIGADAAEAHRSGGDNTQGAPNSAADEQSIQ